MNRYQKELIKTILLGILYIGVGLFFIVGGIKLQSKVVYVGIIWMVLYGVIYVWRLVSFIKNRELLKLDGVRLVSEQELKLAEQYKKVTDYGNVGFVSFLDSGLKFAAEGKFACVKDFKEQPGYHFAFNVTGTKLVEKPDGYDDVVHYEECLFNIELAYFDGVKLSEEENDNGIVLDGIDGLQGKTVQLKRNGGYVAQIATAETDEIDYGEITFEEWSENAHIIRFRLLATAGVAEVIAGRVNLTEDAE